MTHYEQLQTLLLANSVFAQYSMMGFQANLYGPIEGGTHNYEVTVFWRDDSERDLISFKSRGLLRDGDAYSETYHKNPELDGGWTDFEFYYE